MRTTSQRNERIKENAQLTHIKYKFYYKMIQLPTSAILNFLLYYFLGNEFLGKEKLFVLLSMFVITLFSVLMSNFIGITFIFFSYRGIRVSKFLSRRGSIKRFLFISVTYSFIMSLIFSFGVFNILYSIFGDGSLMSYGIIYVCLYVGVEFFSYGLVSFFYDLVDYNNKLR